MRLQTILILVFTFTATMGLARDYIIYSIIQDVPMGEDNEIVKKNFYVNIGKKQGVREGITLDVLRTVSVQDQYKSKARYNHDIKIGELEVIHAEEGNSIGILKSLRNDEKTPYFEVSKFMIGDQVNIKLK